MKTWTVRPRGARGFTLIELMVVMTVIGILAAIAVPSYTSHVRRVSRTEAKVALMNVAQGLERCFTRYNVYNDAACTADDGLPLTTEQGKYVVTGVINAATFTLTATAQGAQAKDTECGNLDLNQLNVKGISGTGTVAKCW